MSDLKIDPELQSLIPPMTDEEYRQLEANVISDGCRDPLVVWNGIIVDGHNRYKICTEHEIPFTTIDKDFSDRAAAIEWIILNQFGRRNLSPGNRSLLALKLEDVFKEKAKERQLSTLKQNASTVPQNTAERGETREELAKIAGVSHDTIGKVKRIVEKGTPEQVERIKKGDKGNSVRAVYNEVVQKEKPELSQTATSEPEQEAPEASGRPQGLDMTKPEENGSYFDPSWARFERRSKLDREEHTPESEEIRRRNTEIFKQTVRDLKSNRDASYTPDVFFMEYEQLVLDIKEKIDWYRNAMFSALYPLLSATEIVELADCNRQMIETIESLDRFQKAAAIAEKSNIVTEDGHCGQK